MKYSILLAGLVFASVVAIPAMAGQGAVSASKPLGVFGNWRAYATSDHGQNVCYMALKTTGPAIKKAKRGPVILMITQRPAENTHDVVSYAAGYNFKAASDLKVTIGKASFSMFTQKDTAWSRDAMTDHAIALAIRKGSTLTATGSPAAKGAANVTDTINLKGSVEAYQAIGKACGMDVEPLANPAAGTKKKPKK